MVPGFLHLNAVLYSANHGILRLVTNTMRSRHRITAMVALLLMAQFAILGSGLVCPTLGHTTSGVSAMPSMHMARAASRSMPDGTAGRPGADQRDAPCRLPWAPDGCHGLAPCAPVVDKAPRLAYAPATPFRHDVSALVVLTPPARNVPPELPPPRV